MPDPAAEPGPEYPENPPLSAAAAAGYLLEPVAVIEVMHRSGVRFHTGAGGRIEHWKRGRMIAFTELVAPDVLIQFPVAGRYGEGGPAAVHT